MNLAFFSEHEKVIGEDYWRSVCESLKKKNFQCCHLVTTVPGTWRNEE